MSASSQASSKQTRSKQDNAKDNAKEADFDAICDAVMETARGRWFLIEYGRRQRKTEIDGLLRAVERLEKLAAENRAAQEAKTPSPAVFKPANEETLDTAARRELREVAQRLSDLCWSLRERGFEDVLCSQLHRLANDIRVTLARGDQDIHVTPPLHKAVFYPTPPKEAKAKEFPFIDETEADAPDWSGKNNLSSLRRTLKMERAHHAESRAEANVSKARALAALSRLERLPLMERLLLFC